MVSQLRMAKSSTPEQSSSKAVTSKALWVLWGAFVSKVFKIEHPVNILTKAGT
jgi:hypothetical protein